MVSVRSLGRLLDTDSLREAVVWCEKLLLLLSVFGNFIKKDNTGKIIYKDVCNKDRTEYIPDGASQCVSIMGTKHGNNYIRKVHLTISMIGRVPYF